MQLLTNERWPHLSFSELHRATMAFSKGKGYPLIERKVRVPWPSISMPLQIRNSHFIALKFAWLLRCNS